MHSANKSESTPTSNTSNATHIITNPDGVYQAGYVFLCNNRTASEVIRLHMFALPKTSPELEALQSVDNSKVAFFVFNLTTRLLSGFFHPVGGIGYDDRAEFFGPRYPVFWRFQLPYPCNQVWYLHESQMPEYLQQNDNRSMALTGPEVSELISHMRNTRQYILLTHILRYQRKYPLNFDTLTECRRQFTHAYGATPEEYFMRSQRNQSYQKGPMGGRNHEDLSLCEEVGGYCRVYQVDEAVIVKSKSLHKWVNGIVRKVPEGGADKKYYNVLREDGIEWYYSDDSIRPVQPLEYNYQVASSPASDDEGAMSFTPAPLVEDLGCGSDSDTSNLLKIFIDEDLEDVEETATPLNARVLDSESQSSRASSRNSLSGELLKQAENSRADSRNRLEASPRDQAQMHFWQDSKRPKLTTTDQNQLQPTLGVEARTEGHRAQHLPVDQPMAVCKLAKRSWLNTANRGLHCNLVETLRIAVPEATPQPPQKRFEAPAEPDSPVNEPLVLEAEPVELRSLALDIGFMADRTDSPNTSPTASPYGFESRPISRMSGSESRPNSRMSWTPTDPSSGSKTTSIWATLKSGAFSSLSMLADGSTVSPSDDAMPRARTPWDEAKEKEFGFGEKWGCRMPPLKIVQCEETRPEEIRALDWSLMPVTPEFTPRSTIDIPSEILKTDGQQPDLDWYEDKMLVSPEDSPRMSGTPDQAGTWKSDGLNWGEADLDLAIPASALDNDSSWGASGSTAFSLGCGRRAGRATASINA